MADYTFGPFWAGDTQYRILFIENLFMQSGNVTKWTIDAVLQIYHYDGQSSTYVDPKSASISIKSSGSTLASGSFSSDIIYASTGWMDLIDGVRKIYTREHSSESHTVSIEASIRSGSTTYTRTISGISFSVPAKPSYAVRYYANDSSALPARGMPSSQTKWYDESLYLTSTKPTRQSYEFWHWNTSSGNGGTTYTSGAYYGSNSSLYLYAIWNPIITYNANGGSGAPASQTKTYGQTLKLTTSKPQRNGYQFLSWNTLANGNGTSYSPGGNYTLNSPTTLYAQWRKVADPPTISSMSVVRCDERGVGDDSGEYCVVRASWRVDTTSAGMSGNTGTVTGTIKSESGSSRSITFSSGYSGTSGSAYALVPNCDTDTQYTVTITVTNSVIGTGQSTRLTTSRADILTRAFFTMDFAAGGKGVGVLTAAPAEGFEVGDDAQFDGDVTVLGDIINDKLKVTNDVTISNVATAVGDITILDARAIKYGPVVWVYISAKSSSTLSAGTTYHICTITQDYRPSYNYVQYGAQYGTGYIASSGYVYFRPFVDLSLNIRASATFIRA